MSLFEVRKVVMPRERRLPLLNLAVFAVLVRHVRPPVFLDRSSASCSLPYSPSGVEGEHASLLAHCCRKGRVVFYSGTIGTPKPKTSYSGPSPVRFVRGRFVACGRAA